MKTAISIPEQVFERVRHHAERLGISRSEFFSRADEMEGAELTEAIDAAVEQAGGDDSTGFTRRAAQRLVACDGLADSARP